MLPFIFHMTQSSNCTKLETGHWKEIAATLANCDNLLLATIDKEEGKVTENTELAHETYSSALKYNDENALSCVVTMAYFTAPAYYNVIRELPSGKGFADFAFVHNEIHSHHLTNALFCCAYFVFQYKTHAK